MPIRDEDGHRAMQAAGKAWKAIKTSGAKTWREWTEVIGAGVSCWPVTPFASVQHHTCYRGNSGHGVAR
jgi:hypothetical protein